MDFRDKSGVSHSLLKISLQFCILYSTYWERSMRKISKFCVHSRLSTRKPQYLKQLQHLQVNDWSWFNKSTASPSELLSFFFSHFLDNSFKVGWRCNPVILRQFHSDTRTRGFITCTVEEGLPSAWINGRWQEMKLLSSQYTCSKEWGCYSHRYE